VEEAGSRELEKPPCTPYPERAHRNIAAVYSQLSFLDWKTEWQLLT
jgi:hypothetical protein